MSGLTLTARCHCSFASFTYTIPHSALPLKASLCHCNSCRYASGQLLATFAVMPSTIPRPDFSRLNSYASSSELTRYSCPKCGAYVGNTEPDEWEFASGMLTSTEGLLDRVQMWIEDTKDGGASIWLQKGHGTNPIRRLRDRQSAEATDSIIEEMRDKSQQEISSSTKPRPSYLTASCHCGAISFSLRPPPTHKYPAFLDACTTCRQTSGFEITSWIHAPQSHLSTTPNPANPSSDSSSPSTSTSASTPHPSNPNLLHYSSSEGVHRYSCKTCTASAFYVNDKRGDSVDIAMGLLRGQGGARAEEWVEWMRGPQYVGDAVDGQAGLVGALGEGMGHLPAEEEDED